MTRKTLRIATVVLALGGLSACGAIQDSQVFQSDFWQFSGGPSDNNEAELGLAELAKGNNVAAQGHFEKALAANPEDVYALYGLAVLYQNTGQPTRARQLYEHILAIRPAPRDEILIWADKQTQPVTDIAQVNLQLLGNGGMAPLPGAPIPGVQGGGQGAPSMAQPQAMSQTQMPQSQLYVQPRSMTPTQPVDQSQVAEPMFKDADLNIVARFKTLRSLLDQGLITQDEFVQRRKANVGALLPLTSNPPATGLDRPVPAVDQISGRLRAIGRALEMRALSPAQHTAERGMILDALMPARPASVANPPPPPKGLMEAADMVRRLEMLKEVDLITSDEYTRERAAIEGAMQPTPMQSMDETGAMAADGQAMEQDAKPKLFGFQPAIHLASYRKQGDAERGWAALQKRFGELAGLEPRIEHVDLGGSKGVFYRLKAGPLPSNAAAKDLCAKLKAKRQYCEPTTINFG